MHFRNIHCYFAMLVNRVINLYANTFVCLNTRKKFYDLYMATITPTVYYIIFTVCQGNSLVCLECNAHNKTDISDIEIGGSVLLCIIR